MQEVCEFTDKVGELQLQTMCNVYNEWRGLRGEIFECLPTVFNAHEREALFDFC